MTPRFIKYNYIIINVKHIKNISCSPTRCDFNIEHTANSNTVIEVSYRNNNEFRRKVWDEANKCLCQFLSELDNEKTKFSSMFDFNAIFDEFEKSLSIEENDDKEFEALL